MGLRDYSILSPEQEQELKEKIEALWYLKDENGDWRYTGTQIARAIGFRAKEAPDNPYAYLEPERIYNYRRKLGIEPRREPRGYPHRYRNKQTDPIDLDTIIRKVEAVPCRDFNNRRKRAGFMLGFWGGFRNTENRLLGCSPGAISSLMRIRMALRCCGVTPSGLRRAGWSAEPRLRTASS